MKHLVLKYKGYSWSTGTQYTARFPEHGDIEVSSPLLLPPSWYFDDVHFKMKRGSNSSSTLYANQSVKIGEINESFRHWDVRYNGIGYKLEQLKRGSVLISPAGMIATIKSNSIGRVICTYNESKNIPLSLLLYLTVYYRISFDAGSG